MDTQCCRQCGLYTNQKPLLDKIIDADVMWVGLSAKKVDNVSESTPLSPDTNSGKIISQIEAEMEQVSFLKSNLVKCLPLDCNQKLRYPTNEEMKLCFNNLLWEMENRGARIVFLLGLNVAKFVLREKNVTIKSLDQDYNYQVLKHEQTYFIPIHHPSFIHVYRRREISKYVARIQEIIKTLMVDQYTNTDTPNIRIA